VKIVLLGDVGVVKSSLVLQFVANTFNPYAEPTIGASFMTKHLFIDKYKVKLQIWDTAGQERFRSMTPLYYRGAQAAILVYDITSQSSFEKVQDWVSELQQNVKTEIVFAIAANKCDLADDQKVSWAKAKEYAKSIGAIIEETSAKK